MFPLLAVCNLSVTVQLDAVAVELIRDVSFVAERGELVGLVGESGSGKSLTALTILGLLPARCRVTSGRVELAGDNLLALSDRRKRDARGGRVGMVFQEPMTALNPTLKVGYQIAETVSAHRGVDRHSAWQEAGRLLDLVALPGAGDKLHAYPHQLSGGQRQRVMIALALAGEPEVLIADEPTSALDVTVQAQILELLDRLATELGLAILLITHDLGVVAEVCQRVMVMYAGELVEQSDVIQLFASPAHPYTRALLATLPATGLLPGLGELPSLAGTPPEPGCLPTGCAFHPRCQEALPPCLETSPLPVRLSTGQWARCWLHADPAVQERG
jgi:peptide/nickel transport system ATP-binding protein